MQQFVWFKSSKYFLVSNISLCEYVTMLEVNYIDALICKRMQLKNQPKNDCNVVTNMYVCMYVIKLI